jgi:hypothetical protein
MSIHYAKLLHLQNLKVKLRHYELELDLKLRTVKDVVAFVNLLIEFLDSHKEISFWDSATKRPTGVLDAEDFARIFWAANEIIDSDILPNELQEMYVWAENNVWLVPLLENIFEPRLGSYSHAHDIRTKELLLYGTAYSSQNPPFLLVRQIYAASTEYTSIEVPINRKEREPDRYLEDLIANLKDDIAQLRKELAIS